MKFDKDLSAAEASEFLGFILDGEALSASEIAEALTALTKKGATVDEVSGFVAAMRARMTQIKGHQDGIDTCGTGGDKSGTFNISTAAAILLSAGGVKVAKHGNRAATSKCGSADVLEALGIPIDLDAAAAAQSLRQHNFAFLFAPLYHPALKRLAIVRKQLGFPTVFNLLGPLLNPAGVKRQVIGTFSKANAELLATTMAKMDYEHAIVLNSQDGLDEASLSAPVNIWEISGHKITKSSIMASDYGLAPAPLSDLQGSDAKNNDKIITETLQSTADFDARQRIVIFNAALGFYVAGKAANIHAGVQKAKEVINSGAASTKLQELTNA